MSTISFETLSKIHPVRDYLAAFTGATGVCLRLGPVTGEPSVHRIDHTALSQPVVIGGEHIATLFSDPFFCGDRSQFERVVRRQKQSGGDGEPDHLAVVSEAQHQGMKDLLRIFAGNLDLGVGRHLLGQHHQDPPCVACARQFIHAHAGDPLTIHQVARHVHLSADHISRRFRTATGMTIVEYLARVRVEKAKELIGNSGIRIAEAAFESGFQSIPYFNRVFKDWVGMSPTQFRASLKKEEVGIEPRKR